MKYLFAFLVLSISLKAQEFKMGDISIPEFTEKYNPIDKTASAGILFDAGNLRIYYKKNRGWLYKLEVKTRLKIYNKEGYSHASISIPYYGGSINPKKEYFKKLKAYTYNYDGQDVEKTKVKKSDIYENQTSKRWKEVSFTFPNLQPGCILEYTYTIESPYFELLPEWKFQDKIPVKNSTYELIFPKILGYNERFKGFQEISRQVEDQKYYSAGHLTGNAVKYIYQAKDIPKIKEEAFVNNYDNYISSVQHELALAKTSYDGNLMNIKTSWNKVAKELMNSLKFGQQLESSYYYRNEADSIFKTSTTVVEKMNSTFEFVKNKMKWNKSAGLYCSAPLEEVYKKNVGNVADINLILTSMLRYVGINAYPVILSTIDNGAPTSIPSIRFYNYVITAVELENEDLLLLDASDKDAAINVLPTRCLNFFGRSIMDNYTSSRVELFPNKKSKDNFIMNINIDNNGKITGQLRRQYTHQFAYQYRKKYRDTEKNDYILSLENELEIDIIEYKIDHMDEPSKAVIETIGFKMKDKSELIGNKIYLKPLVFLAHKENPFKNDKNNRKLPINFTFPKSRRYIVNVTYPKEFEIEFVPENLTSNHIENKVNYSFSVNKTSQGNLQIMVNQNINSVILGPEYFESLKQFYQKIVEKETELIVINKT